MPDWIGGIGNQLAILEYGNFRTSVRDGAAADSNTSHNVREPHATQ